MSRKTYKNLNCKINKSVSNKLEKFIADIKLSKDCYSGESMGKIHQQVQQNR